MGRFGGLAFVRGRRDSFEFRRYQLEEPTTMKKNLHTALTVLIAAVWLVNGLVCKVLDVVPRHEAIVASILGDDYSRPLTVLIGLAEIVMAVWILSGYRTRLNAIGQITVVTTMNILEFILVPDLLLWGRINMVFALIFIGVVYYNEFVLKRQLTPQAAT